MRSPRFALLLGLLAVLVAGSSFAVALSVLDDGEPDPPPPGDDAGDPLGDEGSASTSTTTAVATGELPTPTWIVVIASEADEAGARVLADRVAEGGRPAGVLRSDDYPSLNPGFWVAYTGPYPERGAAEAAVASLEADGVGGTYARCAGTRQECGGDENGNDDDEDNEDD